MNDTRHLRNLISDRDTLAARMAAQEGKTLTARRALALCDKLEKTLPEKIALNDATPINSVQTSFDSEDFRGSGDLNHQARYTDALTRLLADIPEIRKHWQGVLAELEQ